MGKTKSKIKIQKSKIINCIAGWFCFAVAFCTYLLTVEPTASFWDCGEFITAAYKLEIGHPPGAPFFLLVARLFAMLAPSPDKVALMVNVFSALLSALTVMFLYWSITVLSSQFSVFRDKVSSNKSSVTQSSSHSVTQSSNYSVTQLFSYSVTQLFSYSVIPGIVGALAFAFSDTFWFSAVEAEVYGASSLLTAVVFWAILKWEEAAEQPYADRWLILIAYLMGLSIGVHLLNLLAIPAIVLIYYFRKYETSKKGVILAIVASGVILGGVYYLIVPQSLKLASYFELLFVNAFGMPYNSGFLVFLALLAAALTWGIWFTIARKKRLLNTILLAAAVFFIGYSSYGMVVIRALANPPMNQNSPDNVFSLIDYLNREQYGNNPLIYGQYFNAPEERRIETAPIYAQIDGRYEIIHRKVKAEYDPRFCTFFPRMYSANPSHIEMYKFYGDITGRPLMVTQNDGSEAIEYRPTFFENIRFFVTYQLGHKYWRYFMWNFAGRQNDVQADGSILNGNWLSGVPFMDIPRIGSQSAVPEHHRNDASRNRYFMLPFILGMIGLLWHLQRDVKSFWVVMTLFFMTGIAIVIYLNQTPLQPRERDYVYAGSFYAFAIWIGVGVAAVYDLLKQKIPAKAAAVVACALSLSVPVIMAQQNWDDHNRRGRYTARDIAFNYLNSCAPNAILFTVGDNDTFPLWYLQEVEGIRTDVRVVNMMLLNGEWYICQMKRATYDSPPLPVALPREKYLRGRRDMVYTFNQLQDTIPLRNALDFIISDEPNTRLFFEPDIEIDYIMTRNFSIPVDKQKVIANGTVKPEDAELIADTLYFRIPASVLTKGDWIALEIIAANNWERPIYWTSNRHSGTFGLDDYLQLEGTTYRLVPIRTPDEDWLDTGRIDTDILYNRLMNIFRWEGINDPKVWLDSHNLRPLAVVRARHIYTRLAMQLLAEDNPERAAEVLTRAHELFPASKVPYDFFSLKQAEAMYQAKLTDVANAQLLAYSDILLAEIEYYYSLPSMFFDSIKLKADRNVEMLVHIIDISEAYGQAQIGEYIKRSLERRST